MALVEKRIEISATPATIFRIYQDVENWRRWDPDTQSSTLDNGLALGSRGALTPAKGSTVPLEVTSVQENRSFTVTSRTLLFRMDFDHDLEPIEGGTRVVHRVRIAGFLEPFLALLLAPRIDRGLPVTLQRLKARAEAAEAASS